MKQFNKRMILSVFSLLFVFALAGGSVAMARETEGSDDSATHESSETKTRAHDLTERFKKKADDRLKTAREKVKEKTHEERQKSCEARKSGLTNRMNNKVAHAEKHKTTFDNIFTRVKKFHDEKNLNTPDYDALVAKVNTAQADAASNIAALKALDVSIDCTQPKVADSVSSFREAVNATRESLKNYRIALKDLIKAVHDSSENSTDTN